MARAAEEPVTPPVGEEAGHLLARLEQAARADGWTVLEFGRQRGLPLWVFQRGSLAGGGGVYVSAGIHGDEPAGPLALAGLLEERFDWAGLGVMMCPVLNPDGLRAGSRGNIRGTDLNREYRDPVEPETRAHVKLLGDCGRFRAAFLLHEDWETRGCYAYEVGPGGEPEAAPVALRAMAPHIAVETGAEVDGRALRDGVIFTQLDLRPREDWPEAYLLGHRHTDRVVNLETPSSLPLERRVAAQADAVRALARWAAESTP
jgi:hypothetical protein